MPRKLSNFLESYFEYARHDLVPDDYTRWMGLSMIAAALERKVWISSRGNTLYPNLFVALVGHPGNGKSLAIKRARPIFYGLRQLREATSANFKIIEGIATQAGTLEEMEILCMNPKVGPYSSMYVVGSEGSDSALKNHADDFRSTACAMYDCDPMYEKRLKTKYYQIPQPVMNLIVGTTFDFLGTIVDQNSVMGGLASRFAYVIDEKKLPDESGIGEDATPDDLKLRDFLTQDLFTISNLVGDFRMEKSAVEFYNDWWKGYKKVREATESERVKSILVRKPLLIQKLMMNFAVASGDELGIRVEHVEEAVRMVEYVTRNTTRVISSAMIANRDTQTGLNQIIIDALARNGRKMKLPQLKKLLMINGSDVTRFDPTFKAMSDSAMIQLSIEGNITNVELLIDPDTNL